MNVVSINRIADTNACGMVGHTIASIKIGDVRVVIEFADGPVLTLSDDGQKCCEDRHFTCDDDLAYVVGSVLCGIEFVTVDGIVDEDDDNVHEIQLLKIATSRSMLTVVAHNRHNGYYAGFAIAAALDGGSNAYLLRA